MKVRFKQMPGILKGAAKAWSGHHATRLGAALAFYTIFAIAPLFMIVLAIAGMWFGEDAAREHLFREVSGLVGEEGGEAIQSVVAAADRPKAGAMASVIAVGTLFIGATGLFVHLQGALNTVWEVKHEKGKGVRGFIRDRLLSFAMIVAIGFLLLVSLIVSAGLAAFGKFASDFLPAEEIIWQTVNFLLSVGVSTVLFALIFKVLPDVKINWRDVWLGAVLTAILFNIGKSLLSLYLGRGTFMSAYGAAGSLVVILVWVYYSSQLLFFGAEVTRLCTKESCIVPKERRELQGKQGFSTAHAVPRSGKGAKRRFREWLASGRGKKARKVLVGIVGSVVLAVGVVLLFIPGPAFVVIPAGFGILALEFHWARRVYDKGRAWLEERGWFKHRGRKLKAAGPGRH